MTPSEFRDIRKSLGLSQEALARRIGITVRQMHAIENGDEIPLRYEFALRWVDHCMRTDRMPETA